MNISKIFEAMSKIINIFDEYSLSTEEALAISSMIDSIANQATLEEADMQELDLKSNKVIVLSYDETLLSENH